MKKVLIRFFVIFIIFLVSLNFPYLTNSPEIFASDNFLLYVGNTQVTTENANKITQDNLGNYTAKFDITSSTLYLKNFNLTETSQYYNYQNTTYGIYTDIENLKIVFESNCSFGKIVNFVNNLDYGVFSPNNITIQNNYCKFNTNKESIYCNNLIIENHETNIYSLNNAITCNNLLIKNCKAVVNANLDSIICKYATIEGSSVAVYNTSKNNYALKVENDLIVKSYFKSNKEIKSILSCSAKSAVECKDIYLENNSYLKGYSTSNTLKIANLYVNKNSKNDYAYVLANIENLDNHSDYAIYGTGKIYLTNGQLEMYSPYTCTNMKIEYNAKHKFYGGDNKESSKKIKELNTNLPYLLIGYNLFPIQIDLITLILSIVLVIFVIILVTLIVISTIKIYAPNFIEKRKRKKLLKK